MAFCINCGEKIKDGAKFCPECGESQEGTTHQNQRNVVYEGDIHKCPSCGEVLDSFEVNCPACGHEFRGAKNSTSVREFAAKLEEIEKTRPSRSGLKKILANQNEVSETDLSKISLIRSFVIPNTKEDMLEFLVLASSNINLHRYNDFDPISESEKAVSDAWQAKFEQAYEKAKISFGDTAEFQKIHAIYKKKSGEVEKSKKKRIYLWVGLVSSILIMLVALYAVIFGMVGSQNKQITAENERLEIIVDEVYAALEADNYVLARAKAATLVFSGPDNKEADIAAAKWDTTRIELLSIIDNAESSMNTGVSTEITDTTTSKADTTQSAVQTTKTATDTTTQTNSVEDVDDEDKSYVVSDNTDSSVEIVYQENEYLNVKEFSWFIGGDYLKCVLTITNISEYAVELPEFRITAYDENGNVMGVEEHVLSLIYPQQDFSSYNLMFEISKKPSKITVTLLEPQDYKITSVNMLDFPTHKQMIGKNISINSEAVTGMVYNPNDYDIDSAMVTLIFRDDRGQIVYGENTFIDQIPANGSVPFEAIVYGIDNLSSSCEVLAYIW